MVFIVVFALFSAAHRGNFIDWQNNRLRAQRF